MVVSPHGAVSATRSAAAAEEVTGSLDGRDVEETLVAAPARVPQGETATRRGASSGMAMAAVGSREPTRGTTGGTVTKACLVEVAATFVERRKDATKVVEDALSEISACLVAGEDLKLSGFGTFGLRHKAERVGRNPRTGVEARIAPRRSIVFKASPRTKARVNGKPWRDDPQGVED